MKVTKEQVEAKIIHTQYLRPSGTTLTICVLTLENGFTATGESACVDPEEFDFEIGMEIAHKEAFNKAWMLEGYLLAEQMRNRARMPAGDFEVTHR